MSIATNRGHFLIPRLLKFYCILHLSLLSVGPLGEDWANICLTSPSFPGLILNSRNLSAVPKTNDQCFFLLLSGTTLEACMFPVRFMFICTEFLLFIFMIIDSLEPVHLYFPGSMSTIECAAVEVANSAIIIKVSLRICVFSSFTRTGDKDLNFGFAQETQGNL